MPRQVGFFCDDLLFLCLGITLPGVKDATLTAILAPVLLAAAAIVIIFDNVLAAAMSGTVMLGRSSPPLPPPMFAQLALESGRMSPGKNGGTGGG
jgi:hypothetical protein